ncbi:MAG: von Willebrand factor type A domain-containing protein [Chthoniobacterales bacterium]|nr:von Willebrand factor type A domain-containing protein [Chthoniobacterales bacterium]
MNINLDDPILTAFALEELSGGEKEAIEKAVAASPEAQARAEEIRTFARLVRSEFRLDLQRAAEKRLSILSLLQQGNLWSDWRWVSLAAAALLAIAAVIAAVTLSPGRSSEVLADKESKAARRERVVQMEVDSTPPELLASNAAPSSAPAAAAPVDRQSGENPFAPAASNPVSTFPVQSGTAAYAKVRRSISSGSRPPKDAVQIDQMINYFSYDYPQPEGDRPFSVNVDAATCPWKPGNQLVRIGLKGREIPNENRGPSNLVFLLDVSGSMQSADRLPLIKSAMRLLVDRLTENDRVAIVVYAGASGVALPSTRGNRKEEIVRAIEELKADALADGVEGIELAYRIAADNFTNGGVNRVIVATDGELNVGLASDRELVQLANKKARAGVSLTMLRVGNDPAKHVPMQKIAARVGGSYAHVRSLQSGRNVLLQQINATLATIAKDVEIEVVFNPARVSSYRLIGYDNGGRRNEDSTRDALDGGDIAAGHTVTALYQIVPNAIDAGAARGDLLRLKLHHKQPGGSERVTTEHSLHGEAVGWAQAPADFRFVAAVAQFGMILRDSPHKGNGTLANVLDAAQESKGADSAGYRAGFVELVRQAQTLPF